MKRFLCIVMAVLLLCGCENEDSSYSKGSVDYEMSITSIEVSWIDGGVDVVYGDQNYISLFEDANRELNKEEQSRSKIEDGVLKIKYCKDETEVEDANKHLTISLPQGTELKSFICNNKNATIALCQIAVKDEISCTSKAGIFEANLISGIKQININGDSVATSLTTQKVDALNITSVNGYSVLTLNSLPTQLSIAGEKGDICIWAKETNFSLKIPNTETEIFSDLEYTIGDSAVIFGDGSYTYCITIPELTLRVNRIQEIEF